MQIKLIVMLCLLAFNSLAYDHSYDVYGEDENGNEVEGTIYSTNGEREVTGELTNSEGESVDFSGEWSGYREINGETDDGTSVELYTD